MTNCMLAIQNSTLSLMVGSYARHPDDFSPLVEDGETPTYTPLENGAATVWEPHYDRR